MDMTKKMNQMALMNKTNSMNKMNVTKKTNMMKKKKKVWTMFFHRVLMGERDLVFMMIVQIKNCSLWILLILPNYQLRTFVKIEMQIHILNEI